MKDLHGLILKKVGIYHMIMMSTKIVLADEASDSEGDDVLVAFCQLFPVQVWSYNPYFSRRSSAGWSASWHFWKRGGPLSGHLFLLPSSEG